MDDAPDEKKSIPLWVWSLAAVMLVILAALIWRNRTAASAPKAGRPKPRIRSSAKRPRETDILKWSKGAFVQ